MQAGDFLMAEKNSNQSNFIRRQKDAQIPSSIAPMKRKAKPEDPAQKPLLNSVTLQEDLTELEGDQADCRGSGEAAKGRDGAATSTG